jgi:iron uptake system component EfeO
MFGRSGPVRGQVREAPAGLRDARRVLRRPALATLVALTAAGCGAGSPPSAGARAGAGAGTTVTVSVSQCGQGWTAAHAGPQHFVLKNTDTRAGEVLLTDAASAAVYAEVESLAPGTRSNLDIELGSGTYAFRCAMEDEDTVVGRPVTIPGHVAGPTKPVAAATQADLIQVTQAYESYVKGRIPRLVLLTGRLRHAVTEGDLAAAKADWLPAHLEYERLGAAYDAFGDLDREINGRPSGLPGGVHDPNWAGFHRVEYGLWHGESAKSLKAPTAALAGSVGALGAEFATAQINPLDVSIRAHEITENAVQFELTGETDFGSHSNLATVRANLDGTRTVLAIIHGLLAPRDADLPRIEAELTTAQEDLDAVEQHGHWPAPEKLSRSHRERIDADLSQLTEDLATVAAILEPRRDS